MRNTSQIKRRPLYDHRRRQLEKLEDRLLLAADMEFRSFDGSGNNLAHEDWGAANTKLLRLTTVEYGPGDSGVFPALATRVDSNGDTINPRRVSNLLFDQDESVLNDRSLTGFTFQWGQFMDHDMDLTEDFVPVGSAELDGENISFFVPADGTESELPSETVIPQLRSRFEFDDDRIAQQINQITSYIDSSNVYGSANERAEHLRAGFGGFMLTSDAVTNLGDGTGNFLPFNFEVNGEFLENAAPPTTGTGVAIEPDDLFVAGDVRSNEQPGLTSLHTLFVLEHNYQARRIAEKLDLSPRDLARAKVDEYVFQLARATVVAEVQSITYNEFLPALFGPDQLESYRGYQDDVNASIANVFSGALYRVGHTMLPNELQLLNEDGNPVTDDLDVLGASVIDGQVALGEAFFNPDLVTQFGVEPYLKGLAEQQIQEIDNLIVDGVRNLLFDPPAAVDLGATNLQRGRDHGLADYNQTRVDVGLTPVTSFSQISSDPNVSGALSEAYDGDFDNVDVFAGAISEDRIPGGSVGELLQTVLVDQFARLRDGDRFYYENVFRGRQLAEIQNTRLSDVIRRNTGLREVQDEVFRGANVFTYRAEEGRGRLNVTLRVHDDEIQVTKGSGNRVIARQALDETDVVVIFGSSKNDKIRIHSSVAAMFEGSVEVHGGGKIDRLVVKGTAAADTVVVAPTEVRINNLSVYYGNIEKLVVQSQGGDDWASVAGLLGAKLTLAGGEGNDILTGGGGNEQLFGGAGRDVLVGGNGTETLHGNGGQDVLIAGETAADLLALRTTWTSASSYKARVDQLHSHVASLEDGARDHLLGGPGEDWLLMNALDIA